MYNWEVKSRFMTSLTGAEMSDNCGLWAPRLISAIPLCYTTVYILSILRLLIN